MNPEVFKQAQSRGWMEGWEYVAYHPYRTSYKYIFRQRKIDQEFSLNDILFGTDFCEKFIGGGPGTNYESNCLKCGIKLIWGHYDYEIHQREMINMSEPERIAFLEKHLEVKEATHNHRFESIKFRCTECGFTSETTTVEPGETKDIGEGFTASNPTDKKRYVQIHYEESLSGMNVEYSQTKEICSSKNKCGIEYKGLQCFSCYESEMEVKDIEKLEGINTLYPSHPSVEEESYHAWYMKDLKNKLNELVKQTNANTEAISACAKDCKLNIG